MAGGDDEALALAEGGGRGVVRESGGGRVGDDSWRLADSSKLLWLQEGRWSWGVQGSGRRRDERHSWGGWRRGVTGREHGHGEDGKERLWDAQWWRRGTKVCGLDKGVLGPASMLTARPVCGVQGTGCSRRRNEAVREAHGGEGSGWQGVLLSRGDKEVSNKRCDHTTRHFLVRHTTKSNIVHRAPEMKPRTEGIKGLPPSRDC